MSVTLAVCVVPPFVPRIRKVNVPVEVDVVVLTVIVEEPEPVTEVGLKDAVAPNGNPRTENVTTPLKPLLGVMVTVYVVLLGRVTVRDVGEAEIENPGGPEAFTTRVTVAVCVSEPLTPVMVNV